MTEKKARSLEVAEVKTKRRLHVAVMHVQKCNFNDTYYLHTEDIPLASLDGAPLRWFDPYYGYGKNTDVRVAVAYATDKVLYMLEKRGDEITVHKKEPVMDVIITDSNDKSTFIASHMYMA